MTIPTNLCHLKIHKNRKCTTCTCKKIPNEYTFQNTLLYNKFDILELSVSAHAPSIMP